MRVIGLESEVSTFPAPFFRRPESSKFFLASPQKVLDFWRMMGSEKSPLRRESRAVEQRCYHFLGCLLYDSQLLIDFCDFLEAGLSSCLSVGGRRKAETELFLLDRHCVTCALAFVFVGVLFSCCPWLLLMCSVTRMTRS